MFSRVQFRPGYPDISCRNKQFVAIAASGGPIIGSAGANFSSGFQPQGNEIQFEKLRVSAAYNSELLTLLDSQCIDTVVLAGLFTSGVILSTTRQLADADYTIYIVQDAVIDPNSTVNAVLLDSVLPAQANILTISQAINKL
jgi:nicotinamidase-related amidase